MLNNKIFNIQGILLLDKPMGFSCNYILQSIKRIFSIKKAGYIGTLDPLATGVLPICFGAATKFSSYLNDIDKKYIVVIKLGEKTNTSDSYGYVVNRKSVRISYSKVKKFLKNFIGHNKQIPSMYSAIKFCGIPLYKYIRQNIYVPPITKIVNIYDINLIYIKKNKIKFKVHCSKGTYIRTLVENLGDCLGCGAHVINLRRIQMSYFYESNLISYYKIINCVNRNNFCFLKNKILPIENLTRNLPKIYISDNQVMSIKNGKRIPFLGLCLGFYAIFKSSNNSFIGVGKIKKTGYLYPNNVIF